MEQEVGSSVVEAMVNPRVMRPPLQSPQMKRRLGAAMG